METENSLLELDLKLRTLLGIWPLNVLVNEAKTINTWKNSKPVDVWTRDDGQTIRSFYRDNVEINGSTWQINCECIDYFLDYLFKNINEQVRNDYPYLQLQRFVRQGSARDGLKVLLADEFDAVLPFKFVGFHTEVIEHPENGLPPGIAEVKVMKTHDDIKPAGLIQRRSDGNFISTKVFHDTLFKSMIDKVLDRYQNQSDKAFIKNRPVMFIISRRSNAPALTLTLKIPPAGIFINVDIVPGYLMNGSTDELKKFLVTKWIHESQNVTLKVKYPNPDMTWRISLSHFEMKVFEDFQDSSDINAHRLITACRILKVLQSKNFRFFSSQFKSVLKSYHLKNILLYSLLFIKIQDICIPSVSAALGSLVALLRVALLERNLPQFFTDSLALKIFFPAEPPYQTKENLLVEKSPASLDQACRDMRYILQLYGMGDSWSFICPEIEHSFEKRINEGHLATGCRRTIPYMESRSQIKACNSQNYFLDHYREQTNYRAKVFVFILCLGCLLGLYVSFY